MLVHQRVNHVQTPHFPSFLRHQREPKIVLRRGAVSDLVEARVELFIPRRAAQHVATHGYALQPCEAQAEPAIWDDGRKDVSTWCCNIYMHYNP